LISAASNEFARVDYDAGKCGAQEDSTKRERSWRSAKLSKNISEPSICL